MKPWDVAPLAERGDSSAATIHQAVGLALEHWEMLDGAASGLFAYLIGGRAFAAEAAYYEISSISMRLKMVKLVADRVLRPPSDISKGLDTLLQNVSQLAARRNDIAHGVATGFHGRGPHTGVYLTPRFDNLKKMDFVDELREGLPLPFNFHAYAYTSAQILAYAMIFDAFKQKLYALIRSIQEHYGERLARLPKSGEPLTLGPEDRRKPLRSN